MHALIRQSYVQTNHVNKCYVIENKSFTYAFQAIDIKRSHMKNDFVTLSAWQFVQDNKIFPRVNMYHTDMVCWQYNK